MPSPRGPLNFPCANCGAQLMVDGSTQTPICTYCNTETLLPEAIWLRLRPLPELAPAVRVSPGPTASQAPKSGKLAAIVLASVVLLGLAAIAVAAATAKPTKPTATASDPCGGRHAACSSDQKAELECDSDGKMVVTETCKGPNGCRVATDGKSLSCDTTLADVNDPCNGTDDACSTDHKAELRCRAGRFAVISTCKGPDGCTLTPSKSGVGYTLSCDDHVADVGDPCFDSERTACSSDKKAYLTCTAQRFAVDRTCKKGCTAKKVAGTSNVEMTCR